MDRDRERTHTPSLPVRTSIILHENTTERPSSGRENMNGDISKNEPSQLHEKLSSITLEKRPDVATIKKKKTPEEQLTAKQPFHTHKRITIISKHNNSNGNRLDEQSEVKVSRAEQGRKHSGLSTTIYTKFNHEKNITPNEKSGWSRQNSITTRGPAAHHTNISTTTRIKQLSSPFLNHCPEEKEADELRYELFGPDVAKHWEAYTMIPGVKSIPEDSPEWKVALLQKKNCQVIHNHLRIEEEKRRMRELERIETERQRCVPTWMKTLMEEKRQRRQLQPLE